jgi:hypothetical protein
MATSATGGKLTTALPNEVALRRFLQGVLVGVTGLEPSNVRPRWQTNPPVIPDATVDWAAFGISKRTGSSDVSIEQKEFSATINRQEQLEVLVSVYGPNAESYCELFREGIALGQNRETLFLACIGSVETTPMLHVPELLNNQWYNRCDFTWVLNRETNKDYQILCLVGAIGAIITETMNLPYAVSNP